MTTRVKPKKNLGQHFLANDGIARRIANALLCEGGGPGRPMNTLEVGCGTGALTRHLLCRNDICLKGIEIDGESIDYLRENLPAIMPNLYQADFLKSDLRKIFAEGDIAIIGNFPYNISSQIFFKGLDNKDIVPQVVGMLQKEVAERLASGPGNKSYGILSVLLQAWYDIEYLFTVGENEFIARFHPLTHNSTLSVLHLVQRRFAYGFKDCFTGVSNAWANGSPASRRRMDSSE